MHKKSFRVVNIDYCGSCHGKCATCLLTAEERANDLPFFNRESLIRAFVKAVEGVAPSENFVLGFGRGNTLSLPEFTIDDIARGVRFVFANIEADQFTVEVSTSLVGKLDQQIVRAKAITRAIDEAAPDAEVRFVIVVDPQRIDNEAYWRNITGFLDEMAAWRGAGDGSGDALAINISSAIMPDLDTLYRRIGKYRSPVNIIWIGESDLANQTDPATHAAALEAWLTDFYEMMKESSMDASLVERTDIALHNRSFLNSMDDCQQYIAEHGKTVTFISPEGVVMKGGAVPLGDLDPLRYPSFFGNNAVVSNVSHDLFDFLRMAPCRGCQHTKACIASGMYKFALMNSKHISDGQQCPSLMRGVFDKATMYV